MAQRPQRRPIKSDLATLARDAAARGDLQSARNLLEEARRHDKRSSELAINHALVCEHMGDVGAAMASLSEGLRLLQGRPAVEPAARRLSAIMTRFEPKEPEQLDPFGLKVALAIETVDHAPIAGAALDRVKRTTRLGGLIEEAGPAGIEEAARSLVVRRTDDVLKDDLLLIALEKGINKDPALEPMLRGLRRALLLDVPPERFEDKALTAFAIALARQAANNGHVWASDAAEEQAAGALSIDLAALAAGEFEPSRRLLLRSLYQPIEDAAAGLAPEAIAQLRPKALRDFASERIAERKSETEIAASLEQLGSIEDPTSAKVAGQYEKAPYPRWTSVIIPAKGAVRQALTPFVGADKLAFFDAPFDVLIAGCGTGRQALQTAAGFGDNARVLAVDLSRASLAYAKRMAARHGIGNVAFARADILKLPALKRRFKVIESIGVLHHMADPEKGLRALVECLEPGGLLYLGLYSRLSRRAIAALREESGYPGPDCSDAEARGYRLALMRREELKPEAPGMGFVASRDFYSLNEFRDLVLHQSEMQVTLPQIAEMLQRNGLAFRGFTHELVVRNAFAARYPDNKWPGRLEDWHSFEEQNPRIFDAMYRFWCEKAV
jgi:SAM-dependent methyltransferase